MNEQIERICLSPNSECNLNCKYCYFYNPEKKDILNPEKLNEEEILVILNKIEDYCNCIDLKKKIKLNFVGSGEPLLSWSEIYKSLKHFKEEGKGSNIRFYMVTNGILLNSLIIKQLKEMKIDVSVSLDGPPIINDKNRITKAGKGTFNKIIKKIEELHLAGFQKIINTTITWELIEHLEEYFNFLVENKINKVIFGRLVDVPSSFRAINYDEYYEILSSILEFYKANKFYKKIEIGNFESYRRSIDGIPDKVCTMFGSCCGAGISNLIYLQRDVFPCGRMFNNIQWKLGDYSESLEVFQERMFEKISNLDENCNKCEIRDICINDCIVEKMSGDYNCVSRKNFILKMKSLL